VIGPNCFFFFKFVNHVLGEKFQIHQGYFFSTILQKLTIKIYLLFMNMVLLLIWFLITHVDFSFEHSASTGFCTFFLLVERVLLDSYVSWLLFGEQYIDYLLPKFYFECVIKLYALIHTKLFLSSCINAMIF